MPGDRTIVDGGGSVFNGNRVRNFSQALPLQTRLLRATNGSLGPEAGLQLLLQDPSGLNIQAALDGFVGHACVFSVRIVFLQPPGNLLRRPLLLELGGNGLRKGTMLSQLTPFGAMRAIPGGLVC